MSEENTTPSPRRTPSKPEISPDPAPADVGKFSVIYDPKQTCSLKTALTDPDDCHDDFYVIIPATSGFGDEVVKGCSLHLPRISLAANSNLVTLEFDQMTKPRHQRAEDGKTRLFHPPKNPDTPNEELEPVMAREVQRRDVIDLQNVIDYLINEFKPKITDLYEQ